MRPYLPGSFDGVSRTLRDVLAFADAAARLVERGKPAYDTDETLQLAAEAILHKIGEAVGRLPDRFQAIHPDVAWRSMKATRNVVAHAYDRVDYEIVWRALAYDLPTEAARIRHIAAELEEHRS